MTNTESNSSDFLEFCKSQLSPLISIDPLDFLDDVNVVETGLGSEDERETLDCMSHQRKPSVIKLNMDNYFCIADTMAHIHSNKLSPRFKKDEKEQNDTENDKEMRKIKTHQIMIEKDQSVEENKSVSPEGLDADKEKRVITVVSKPGKKSVCNCRKTHCLKLYCDCLAQGKFCGPDCYCVDCKNNSDHVVINTMEYTEGNEGAEIKENAEPNVNVQSEVSVSPVLKSFKGCNCKKSGCKKKYCECYAMGMECGKDCHCLDCKNKIQKAVNVGKKPSNANLVKKSAIRKMEKGKKKSLTKIQAIKDLKEKTLSIIEEDGKVDLLYLESKESA